MPQKKIGVFVCHCGINIASVVQIEELVKRLQESSGVYYATDYKYMCSEPGQASIRDAIKEKELDGIVVACCSPSLHELTFRRTSSSVDLNPYLCEIANIREHCSWVHSDSTLATEKAQEIIETIVEKVRLDEALDPIKVPVNKRAMVIGGGISGIQSALDIADSGYPVILVEREAAIGGHMAELSDTFLTLEKSSELLSAKQREVSVHSNIQLLTYSEVEDLDGYVGNFKATIKKKAKMVDWDKCDGCGKCIAVCPVKVPFDQEHPLGKENAIYLPLLEAGPKRVVIDKGICQHFSGECSECQTACPKSAIHFDEQDETLEEEIGAVVVATGYSMYPKDRIGEYGVDGCEDVIDGLQFERMLAAWERGEGPLRRPSDGKTPRDVVFVQCSGSRDPEHAMPYCSRICCMYTVKEAMVYRKAVPDGQAYVFYIDIRTGGKGCEEFTQGGIADNRLIYMRGKVSKLYREGDKVVVWGVDTLMGKKVEIAADLVVLATATVPSPGAKELAQRLKVSADDYGFFQEVHPKLRPVESPTAGIFLSGAARAPMDIPESIMHASGAASKVLALFSQDDISHEPIVAFVDEDYCSGCGVCVETCPYGARELQGRKRVAKVIEVLCQGCGACIAACPNGACQQRNFQAEQCLYMLDAAL
ncbi:MAG: CoB--CoM heterodisulfide reductase iron-sulfur subunit A family protein [Gemmatimonadota bacterium]|nr:MAG: CoB--CoM heterodisulfide reductase iron-sulfur subunit A family protein [Gemmatimonadota bacterium]